MKLEIGNPGGWIIQICTAVVGRDWAAENQQNEMIMNKLHGNLSLCNLRYRKKNYVATVEHICYKRMGHWIYAMVKNMAVSHLLAICMVWL